MGPSGLLRGVGGSHVGGQAGRAWPRSTQLKVPRLLCAWAGGAGINYRLNVGTERPITLYRQEEFIHNLVEGKRSTLHGRVHLFVDDWDQVGHTATALLAANPQVDR